MNLVQIENELVRLNAERKQAIESHEYFMDQSSKEINELLRQKEMAMEGIDLEKVKTAEFILAIRGLEYGEYNERCVDEAIKDIATGTDKMKKQYFGVKNYAQWTHQHCDCQYGYGPSHGSIVFSVGYNFLNVDLTDDEKECCIYYLNLLKNKSMRETIRAKTAKRA